MKYRVWGRGSEYWGPLGSRAMEFKGFDDAVH